MTRMSIYYAWIGWDLVSCYFMIMSNVWYNLWFHVKQPSVICESWHFTPCRKHLHECIISLRGDVWVRKTSLNQTHFIEVPAPIQESEWSCICVLEVSSQESERSCICVLEVSSQESERSCTYMLRVSSQESERSCIYVLRVSSKESERSCI